jgi:hypothetical protein
LLAGGILALVVWRWWRRRFAGYAERSLPVLALVPLLGLLLQSYGGQLDLHIRTFTHEGYSPSWQPRLLSTLDARPGLRRALTNDDVTLYELTRPPAAPAAAVRAGPAWPHFSWSGWRLLGAEAALTLIALLMGRELLRAVAPPGPRMLRNMRTLHWIGLPLLLVLAGALAERVSHFTS